MMASTGLGFRRRILSTLIVCVCAADVLADESDALDALRQAYPSIKVLRQNSRIDRLHSGFFSTGDSARDSAERFRTAYSDVFGVPPEDLKELSDSSRDPELPLMFDRQTGVARFELISYAQERDGVAVFRSELRLLVRNESQFPLVLAASSLKSLGQFEVDSQVLASLVDPEGLERAFAKGRVLVAAEAPELTVFGDATPIIWAGTDDDPVATPK
ncbi:MAG: hypothetical protein GXP29_07665, partial [Planctomycetes bacterium]|nr:hypothetical protein [Planctomycetota bacterium]